MTFWGGDGIVFGTVRCKWDPEFPLLGNPKTLSLCLCPMPIPPLNSGTPVCPWQSGLKPNSGHGSCLMAGPRPTWLLPRPPSARAWWSPARLAGRNPRPRPASRGLAPPEGCGLGTTGCLLREAAGISRTNREPQAPRPPEQGSCLWPLLPVPHSPGLAPHFCGDGRGQGEQTHSLSWGQGGMEGTLGPVGKEGEGGHDKTWAMMGAQVALGDLWSPPGGRLVPE